MLGSLLRHLLKRRNPAQSPLASDAHAPSADACLQALNSGDLDFAVRCFRTYLNRQPDDAAAHNDLGVALQRQGKAPEALACYERAARIAPGNADGWYNAGTIHHLQGDIAQAEDCYRKALAANPDCAEAHREYSMLRLAQGQFGPEVWASFGHRRRCAGFQATVTGCEAPCWNGEPLAGKTILVHGEQGLGDEVLFASCYPDLIAAAARCVIETDPRLESLFRRSFAPATVLGRDRAVELRELYAGIAYRVPSGDLPLHFRATASAFPDRAAYLAADEGAVKRWRAVLARLGTGLKIGISWRGGTARTNEKARSVDLEQWRTAFEVPGVHFVSLQYGECAGDLARAQGLFSRPIHHWPEAIADYDQTAALVRALDLVITVTTSLAHLSGALGQETWILANAAPRWCYLASGSSTPWYPSARLLRQTRLGEWSGVMRQVAERISVNF